MFSVQHAGREFQILGAATLKLRAPNDADKRSREISVGESEGKSGMTGM